MANHFPRPSAEWLLDGIRQVITDPGNGKCATIPQLITIHRLIDLAVASKPADAEEVELWMRKLFPGFAKTGTLTSNR
ncbi:hypothetical protein G6011_04004 [Alternaria panax]|uniref:Uncharacterized protein n=1 Tax=Alternaria panax TaxID=48097 RepID=A0AAD4IG85_9PLEO|nr:hypothetical protein G6011_04004 [Alternaria panax]